MLTVLLFFGCEPVSFTVPTAQPTQQSAIHLYLYGAIPEFSLETRTTKFVWEVCAPSITEADAMIKRLLPGQLLLRAGKNWPPPYQYDEVVQPYDREKYHSRVEMYDLKYEILGLIQAELLAACR